APDLLALVAGVRIPYPNRPVVRTGDDPVAVGRYRDGCDWAIVSLELELHFLGLDVPDAGDLVVGACDEALAVARHGHGVHDVLRDKGLFGARQDVPDVSLSVPGKADDAELLGRHRQGGNGAALALERSRFDKR